MILYFSQTAFIDHKLISLFSQAEDAQGDYREHSESRPRLTPGRAMVNSIKKKALAYIRLLSEQFRG